MKPDQIFSTISRLFLEQATIYVFFTIPAFITFWIIGKHYFARRRIQAIRRATDRQLLTEIRNSVGFLVIYACVDALLIRSSETGTAHIYKELNQHGGFAYGALTCLLFFIIDDTYFYWSHRLMHHPWLYRMVHRVHHESIDTSPFTAYSFHPLEGLVELGSVILIGLYAYYLPVHIGALVTWQAGAIAFNVIAHLGYEIYPAYWNDHWLLQWKTPSTHHNMHHEHFDGNYGLYFTWWDRWMGTEFKAYNSQYKHLFTRQQTDNSENLVTTDQEQLADHQQSYRREFESIVIKLAQVNLCLRGIQYSIQANPDEILLDAALRQQVPAPYACRQGRCGTCQARYVKGQVRSNTVSPLSETQQQAGYFLMCQSYADSDRVTIDYPKA